MGLLPLLLACGSCRDPEPVCPEALLDEAPGPGDANGDGRVDVSDGVWLSRFLASGGPPLACEAAVDLLPNATPDARGSTTDLADAVGLWNALVLGTAALPTLERGSCTAPPERTSSDTCGTVELGLNTERVDGTGRFDVGLTLTSELPVEAWSLAIRTEGCSVTGATFEGTAAAEADLDAAGQASTGYAAARAVDGNAIAVAVLSWREPRTLTGEAPTVLRLSMEASVPDRGCEPCVLHLDEAIAGDGLPVHNVVTVGGQSVPLNATTLELESCAG